MKLLILVSFLVLSSCAPDALDAKIKTDHTGQYEGADTTLRWNF